MQGKVLRACVENRAYVRRKLEKIIESGLKKNNLNTAFAKIILVRNRREKVLR
jgi:hypothetical protein